MWWEIKLLLTLFLVMVITGLAGSLADGHELDEKGKKITDVFAGIFGACVVSSIIILAILIWSRL
jgi:nitrogen fixation/metabolism regulation signal transduction histidine kinase